MQHGVINEAGLDDATVGLYTDACDRQLVRVCAAYGLPYSPTIFYANTDNLPVASGGVRLLTIQRTIDVPGARGYHKNLFGLVFSRVLADAETSITMSHELPEESVNPFLTTWVRMPDGREVAMEICDPVQGDTYTEPARYGTKTAGVLVSNYVLPSYFQINGKPPYDRMGLVRRPFEIRPGGYYVVRDDRDNREAVFAKPYVVAGSDAAWATVGAKLAKPESHLAQLLRAGSK